MYALPPKADIAGLIRSMSQNDDSAPWGCGAANLSAWFTPAHFAAMGQCSFLNIDLKLTHTLRAITVATGGVWAGKQAIKLIVPAFEFSPKPVDLLHLVLDRVLAAIQ